jgi:hypothetical protein
VSVELIYCAGGSRRLAQIAINAGYRYGAQLPDTVYFAPYFVDQDWRAPDRARYMAALAEHRPALATVLDLERDEQLPEVLEWAEDAARYVSEAVIIIPKAHGIIARLPRRIGGREVRLGYSVPTKYGATEVMAWEFSGWPVHLLGGRPDRQMELARYLDVRSADGNYAQMKANRFAEFWVGGKVWRSLGDIGRGGEDDAPYAAFALSCVNIRAAWEKMR